MIEQYINELIADREYRIVGVVIDDDSIVFRVSEFVHRQEDIPKTIDEKHVKIIEST